MQSQAYLKPETNHLLAAMPAQSRASLIPRLKLVSLSLGQALGDLNQPLQCVYFPIDCVFSLMHVMKSGHSVEIAMIGHEGMVDPAELMRNDNTATHLTIQHSGHAYQLDSKLFMQELEQNIETRQRVIGYAQALVGQIAQVAACNRYHKLEQQLCRWILLMLDRVPGDSLAVTQEMISSRLGVRREGVTGAAIKLQAAGLIKYSRGRIRILNRHGLEERACECYSVMKCDLDHPPASAAGWE